jgi:hypothetical protein
MSSEILIFTKSLTVGTPSPKVTKNLDLAPFDGLIWPHLKGCDLSCLVGLAEGARRATGAKLNKARAAQVRELAGHGLPPFLAMVLRNL